MTPLHVQYIMYIMMYNTLYNTPVNGSPALLPSLTSTNNPPPHTRSYLYVSPRQGKQRLPEGTVTSPMRQERTLTTTSTGARAWADPYSAAVGSGAGNSLNLKDCNLGCFSYYRFDIDIEHHQPTPPRPSPMMRL